MKKNKIKKKHKRKAYRHAKAGGGPKAAAAFAMIGDARRAWRADDRFLLTEMGHNA